MKISIILGTRPEIIKLSSIIQYCHKKKIDFHVIHTNQHYSKEMDEIFFQELDLPKPKYNLNVGSGAQGMQTGKMIERIESVLLKEKPDYVLVQGDTNTVLAGVLAASKINGIKVVHIEAGLRSYDREMPEEVNRIIADHISDLLYCPTKKQKEILLKEGIESKKIAVTGNTVVDAVYLATKNMKPSILDKYGVRKKQYIFMTMHRPSNVDIKDALKNNLKNINALAVKHDIPVVFAVHPRTMANINKFKLKIPEMIRAIEPVGFNESLALQKYSKIVITDSGGIQEEACILGVPSLNLRENTERPECVDVGASKIVGSSYDIMESSFLHFQKKKTKWKNPFGDGKTGERIIKKLK